MATNPKPHVGECERCGEEVIIARVLVLRYTTDSFEETRFEGYLCEACTKEIGDFAEEAP